MRDLRVERLPPRSGASEAAVYFRLHNVGSAPVRLMGATSALASQVELSRTTRSRGVVRSEPVADGVAVPPGATLVFARGGLSLRLAGWDVGPRHWTRVPLTLRFGDGSELAVSAPRRR